MSDKVKKAEVVLRFNIELDLDDYEDFEDVNTHTEAASFEENRYEEGESDIDDYLGLAINEPEIVITILDD